MWDEQTSADQCQSEEGGRGHVIAQLSCISRSKSMDTSYKHSSMDELALGMMGTQGLLRHTTMS